MKMSLEVVSSIWIHVLCLSSKACFVVLKIILVFKDGSLQCPSNVIWPFKIYLSQNQPFITQPQIENECVTWSCQFYMNTCVVVIIESMLCCAQDHAGVQRWKPSMPFKRDLAFQNIPLSKQPFITQPQIENEDVTWSPWYNMPATRTNERRVLSLPEVELDGRFLILHTVLETYII